MKKIPMTLLTGFLGSGKSTLINRIVKARPDVKFGLVVNEFGDVKLESQIVEARDGEVMELSNGCMCCIVRTDLTQSVRGFLDQRPEVDHLLVEASGLSDPLPIAQTFAADDLGGRIRFDCIVSLVDVVNFSSHMKDFSVAVNQLRHADFVILTKTELVTAKAVQEIKNLVSALAPKAEIYDHQEKTLFDLVLDTSTSDSSRLDGLMVYQSLPTLKQGQSKLPTGKRGNLKQSYSVRHDKVQTLFWKQEKPMDFKKLGALLDNLPPAVVRAKGFIYLNTTEAHRLKVIFQSVAHRNTLDAKPWEEGEKPQTALVFIGKGLDTEALKKALEEAVGG